MTQEAYREMWENLNLDIAAHDGLLGVLGKFYGDIYMSQKGRLQGMEYLDFVLSEVHGLRIKELQDAKAQGRKIIGTFCVFVPEELALAVDAVQVGLCAGADAGKEAAETLVPRNTCALIKSFIGFKLARLCPYTESCDLIVGETTCDGKKKAYEAFAEHAPMYVMEVPQTKTESARALWKAEVLRYMARLEELTGRKVTAEKLAEAIKTVNARRRALQRLNRLRAAVPAPISGRDVLLINQVSFYDDPIRFTASINTLCDQLEERIKAGDGVAPKDAPRVMLSGCPMAVPNWKLPYVIESSGAVIVGEESCIGTRNTRDLTDESGQTLEEMIDALCERYMKIDCACFTPNAERLDNVETMAKDLKVDGVIQYALMFCQPYAHEGIKVEKRLTAGGVPSMSLETDYSMEDIEQLKTRVEAFLETVK
ncbi:Benzoyl-CoA reductase/2-hydroxyglutaryl-CoA dehydratase subunit, BcrC/BadD/HgdB [Desulfomicrobium norvegicum]|uniref:Benzoyl-CoA reductase/2-hydroxyglutaryl-CoA dehydratase subunit, BcrC/BadD/HgdB n=1 Tax=Desulfomicrobium norvegicum (strain DSM 1741 / NCIMB 8310) TaxID=52561 RepID=A0A8G2F6E9_DESNO|nr:double-cubane-cluster-containing anaerobic reductase [Desulfomicrobium norvegicum]SFL87351.1 Benzoyl-CoA reductase/2-hydroxyglutaryl-CoA dehydratase subunit, BcrC/BadD/HgdB [Desulfomicrobium norvegicum]